MFLWGKGSPQTATEPARKSGQVPWCSCGCLFDLVVLAELHLVKDAGVAHVALGCGGGGLLGGLSELLFGSTGPRGGRHPGLAEQAARSAVRTVGSSIGREIVRGVLGSILGGGRRR